MSPALPNLIVVGAPRCGTSALFAYLAAHPEAAGSTVKEVQYFMDEGSALFHDDANYNRHGLAAYHRFFEPALAEKPEASIVFEATPGYMYQRTALEALTTLATRPKIVFQLRKPSAQLYSSYQYSLHRAGNLPRNTPFRDFAFGSGALASSRNEFHRNALAFANYEPFVSNWLAACGKDRVRVTCFETLRSDPVTHLKELALWLGIDPRFYDDYDFSVVNQNVAIRSRALQTAGRRASRLAGGLAPGVIRRLYRQLNTTVPAGPSAEEQAVIAEVDDQLRSSTLKLAQRCGLDPRTWDYA